MESIVGAAGVIAILFAAFSSFERLSVRWGIDQRPPEPAREWWERGW